MVVGENSRDVTAVQLETSELPKLKTQIQELTAQVAALTTQKITKKPIQCFYCKQAGHIQRYCPNRVRKWQCCNCGKLGHITANYRHLGDALERQYAFQVTKSPTDIIVITTTKI